MNKKQLLFSGLALALATSGFSQDSTKGTTTFTTSLDAYYRYDFAGKGNNKTSFTNSMNSFELGMASLKIDHSFKKVAATVDLGFGRRAEEFSYNDGNGSASIAPTGSKFNTLAAIKQAYLSYQATSKIKFTAGKWATHVGWELVDAYANRNYSMSYAFTNGPFFHTGLKADISLGGKTALMVGIASPTDYSTTTSEGKMLIAQLSTASKNDKLKAYLNYQGGTASNYTAGTLSSYSKVSQFDLVLNYTASSKFSAVYNGTIQNFDGNTWGSNVLYLNYDPTSLFGLTWRNELFSDKKFIKVLGAESILASTLSANFRLGNLTIIPEVRLDNASKASYIDGADVKPVFVDKNDKAVKSATSFILAATYKF